jgi:hypothetical protein
MPTPPTTEPKHFTAEPAKIAEAHQLSTAEAQHLGQECSRPRHVSFPAVPLNMGDFFADFASFAVQGQFLG